LAVAGAKDEPLRSHVFAHFADLVNTFSKAKVIAVDIPIGLPEVGARACDQDARRKLGAHRRSSVFPAPLRPVLAASSWEEACSIRLRIEGRKMSRQAWGIVAKVREVDALLRQNPQLAAKVFEVHPELSFAAWAGKPMQHSKKGKEGRAERQALINAEWPDAVIECEVMLRGERYAPDDLYDAFAALWTARRIRTGESRAIPAILALDPEGLPMRIAV
jgi:predicted RNase H-like nuclease